MKYLRSIYLRQCFTRALLEHPEHAYLKSAGNYTHIGSSAIRTFLLCKK